VVAIHTLHEGLRKAYGLFVPFATRRPGLWEV
jgi:hypothetical protein